MKVIERLSAAQLMLRSPPLLLEYAAGNHIYCLASPTRFGTLTASSSSSATIPFFTIVKLFAAPALPILQPP